MKDKIDSREGKRIYSKQPGTAESAFEHMQEIVLTDSVGEAYSNIEKLDSNFDNRFGEHNKYFERIEVEQLWAESSIGTLTRLSQ